jgi:hypothetical protein
MAPVAPLGTANVRRGFFKHQTQDNGPTPISGAPEGTLPNLDDVKARQPPIARAPISVASTLRSRRNPIAPRTRRVGDPLPTPSAFDGTHPFFTSATNGLKSALREVNYSRYRPVVPAPDREPERFFKENTNILTKSHHWKYEKELRMCASPKAAHSVQPGPNGHPIHLFTFPKEAVAQAILGYRMPSDTRNTIINLVREKYPKAELYQTALNESEYDLDVNPYDD